MTDRQKKLRVVNGRDDLDLEKDKRVRRRAALMLILYLLITIGIIARLAWLQLYKGDEYSRMAYIGQTRRQLVRPVRGSIYDRNGKGLAISAQVDTISANPGLFRREVEESPELISQISGELSEILSIDRELIFTKLTSSESFVFIARQIDKEKGSAVRELLRTLGIDSIYVDNDAKRFYPKGRLASHILGFTGVDGQGLVGLELELDGLLKGESGRVLSEVDAGGNPVRFNESRRLEARDGYDVTLTIDETIQDMTEQALAELIERHDVRNGASAIVLNPHTGEVLAMASMPDFDPNLPDGQPERWDKDSENPEGKEWLGFRDPAQTNWLWENVFRNKAVMDTYEPGSTFKPITAAAALEEGLVTLDTIVYCKPFEIGGWTIECWREGGHGELTFSEAMYNSCNPVFSRLSIELGVDRFYRFVSLFGFKEMTGIEVAGEPSSDVSNSLWHRNPTETDMSVASFGQRFQITPIQLAASYSAIANGGFLMRPTLISRITDSDGRVVYKNEPEITRTVISRQTAEAVQEMLEGSVTSGTGRNAFVSGYRVAGKTGTSETLQSENEGRFIVSFASFAPANAPEIVMLIEVDWPMSEASNDIAGGRIVAPIAGDLTERILSYLKIERSFTEEDKQEEVTEVLVPDVTDMTVAAATIRLSELDISMAKGEDGLSYEDLVVRTHPPAGSSVPIGSTVFLHIGTDLEPMRVNMPNVNGMTVERAASLLSQLGINMRVFGSGEAFKQSIEAGELIERGTVAEISFQTPAVE